MLVGRIHQALNDADRVPLGPVRRPVARVTDPDAALVNANRLLSVIADIPEPTAFDDQARQFLEQRMILIDKHRSAQPAAGELSGMYGWTHGDLQYRNILRDGDGVSAVLDWDRVAVKPLAEEVARTAQVQFGGEEGAFDLDRVAAFAAGYRSAVPLPVGDLADAVHRLWWKRLTDYWTFEYHYDRGDTGPDPLMAPGEQLLAWWTERRDEVDRAFIAGA
ncbi:phosphotransferase [Yinghuangia aomiensis]